MVGRFLGLLLACVAVEAAAQQPRIGLALSGGGARGLAHIGVLKVLEEMHVPVHCIAGTSMGSVVGGAYAAGLDLSVMEAKVVSTDFDDLFVDRPPRAEISIRRKGEDYKTLFAPEFGLKGGSLALPKGALAGIAIENYFRQLMAAVGTVDDFDALPIPFHALAADIETGEPVVLKQGNLANAMRASMSVPGAIAPVEMEGRLLVDGGIANNLPIDETRRMCADVVIAVNITTPPLKRSEITSALSVSLQLINLLGKANVDRQLRTLGERDVLISPQLGDIASGNFERAADAIRIGEQATRAMAASLERYRLTPVQYAQLRVKRRAEVRGLGVVDEIRFEGLQRTNPQVLAELMESKPGERLSVDTIGADIRRIYGRGDFESVDWRIVGETGTTRALVIIPREKSWGPDYLRFGLGLATDFHGESPFAILVNYRRTWLNSLGGEWVLEGQAGRDLRASTEFYQPLRPSGSVFVAPYAGLSEVRRSLFLDGTRFADYQVREARAGGDVGMVLGTWGEARLGVLWRHIDARAAVGGPALESVREDTAGVTARLFGDRLDNPWFPRSGHQTQLSAYATSSGFGTQQGYRRLEARGTWATSIGAHTLNLSAIAGTNLGSELPIYDAFILGGPLQLSGYSIGEVITRRVSFGRLMYYNRSLPLPNLIGNGVFLGASLEAARIRGRFDVFGDKNAYSGSVFIAADTFLGPAYFGFGRGDGGRSRLYLLLGVP